MSIGPRAARPRPNYKPIDAGTAFRLICDQKMPIHAIAARLGISINTLYRMGTALAMWDLAAIGASANAFIKFLDSSGTRQGYVGDGSSANSDMYLFGDNGAVRIGANGANTAYFDSNGLTLLGTPSTITFPTTAADKIYYYSNNFGTGVESGTLTNWASTRHRWRIGGTSASGGTNIMEIDSNGLNMQSGQVIALSGNAVTPAYTFSGDTGTGMYRAGSNILSFATGGSQYLRINATGVLTIGATAPVR